MINKITSLLEKLNRKKQLFLLKSHANVSIESDIKLGLHNHFILYANLKKLSIGKSFDIRNYIHILLQNNAVLEIEDNVFMNNFCSINCLEYIKIGENTLFGENVKLYDHNHAYQKSPELKISHTNFTTAPIIIGKNCWLGSNVTVLKGVTIGDNTIIGSGCTIAKDIPANSTVINKQELIFKN